MKNAGASTDPEQGALPGTQSRNRGRQNKDGTEETVKVEPLRKACPRLLRLYGKAVDTMTDYKEALKAACEANGANTADVARLIKASHKGNFEDVRRHVEQQAIIFEAVGEVSPSGE
jgi:hypothetical protein